MKINHVIYNGMTPLDLIGPMQIWSQIPGVQSQLIAKNLKPVTTDTGMVIQPSHEFANAELEPNILFVPGGAEGTLKFARDKSAIGFITAQGNVADWVTSVCTGSLILGAAGLLKGYKATTHWAAKSLLKAYCSEVSDERWVIDRNRATGGGVTSGIDFGLALIAVIYGEASAKRIQLGIEYAPAPPFNSGSPTTADEETVDAVLTHFQSTFNSIS